jgi:2-hydroxychromene-2-carboxylate isomerase
VKRITFYLDFVSPYAYIAFEALPESLEGLSYEVRYKPILFGALLRHNGQLGPAEIPAKRDWTYRQVQWLAHSKGIDLQLPATHPFSPLGLLRLSVATDVVGLPNRYVCETLFHHVWHGGAEASDAQRLLAVTALLSPARDPASAEVKAQLLEHGEDAIAHNVFGVPSFEVDGRVFWGQDALPMLRSYIDGDPWFASAAWDAAPSHPSGMPAGVTARDSSKAPR